MSMSRVIRTKAALWLTLVGVAGCDMPKSIQTRECDRLRGIAMSPRVQVNLVDWFDRRVRGTTMPPGDIYWRPDELARAKLGYAGAEFGIPDSFEIVVMGRDGVAELMLIQSRELIGIVVQGESAYSPADYGLFVSELTSKRVVLACGPRAQPGS